MTKYERARMLGTRALQIRFSWSLLVSGSQTVFILIYWIGCDCWNIMLFGSMNAPVMVELEGETDPLEVNYSKYSVVWLILETVWSVVIAFSFLGSSLMSGPVCWNVICKYVFLVFISLHYTFATINRLSYVLSCCVLNHDKVLSCGDRLKKGIFK